MKIFLINNPDLKDELDGLDDAVLPDDDMVFSEKQSLKNISKGRKPGRFLSDDDFLVAKTEGDLTPDEASAFDFWLLQHPEYEKDFALLKISRLDTEEKVIFENKQLLYKKTEVVSNKKVLRPSRFETDDDFLVAKMEGDLTSEEELLFKAYLIENPELEKDFSLINISRLDSDEKIVFEHKSGLYKKQETVTHKITSRPERFDTDDDFIIAKIEGHLTATEEKEFELYVAQNPDIGKEYSLYKQTILIPDQSLVFEHKSSLKRFEISPKYYQLRKYSLAIASVAAMILFVTFFYFNREDEPVNPENPNYLSMIHRTSENQENVMRENKVSFNGTSEEQATEPNTINIDIKVKTSLHPNAPVDENKNQISETVNKPDLAQNTNTKVDENFKPDNLQMNTLQDQTTNVQVNDPGKQIVSSDNNKQNQTKPPASHKKKVKSEKDNLSFWDLAVMGVRGLSNISGAKIELKKQYDADGNVKALAFNSPNLAFSTPVKKR
jgi:hypothetical protein